MHPLSLDSIAANRPWLLPAVDIEGNRIPDKGKRDAPLAKLLPTVLPMLPPEDADLLNAIYYRRISRRQLAREWGVSHTTINTLEKRALKALRELMDLEMSDGTDEG